MDSLLLEQEMSKSDSISEIDTKAMALACKAALLSYSESLRQDAKEVSRFVEDAVGYARDGGKYPRAAMAKLRSVAELLPGAWEAVTEAVEARRLIGLGDIVSTTGIARLAGLSTRQIGVYVRDGRLKGVRSGRWYRVPADCAKEFLRERGVPGF